ncbi:hypothetical protein [Gemmatimonas sp.]|jgi:hypothetical protein|uniref:hypothetical protein n=1 Tax=Gemmatimonas sp. TaxID=1962908 RepID=UPI0037BE2F93
MRIGTLAALAVSFVTMAAELEAQAPAPAAEQIAAATLALPKEMRDGAGVMGYRTAGKLELLRPVTNGMLCLADDPAEEQFHVSCYADTMEPFMARGRALRAQGVKGAQVDTVRFAEVKGGKIKMPTAPAALYQIFAQSYDAATGTVKGGRTLFVVYVPFATAATTGLSTVPSDSKPWLMLPGTPKAHIMFSASM